ncbi:MAG: hypothetical protein U0169_14285 [Polyangiaceae bacterium]
MAKGGGDSKRRRLEGVIPEFVKRAVEIGAQKASEAPDSFKHLVNELKVPKEIATFLLTQVDETKSGLMRVAATEMREFLEHTNLAAEMQKLLTSMQFEISTTVRFSPNDTAKRESDGEDAPETASDAPANAAGGSRSTGTATRVAVKPQVKTDVFVKRDDRPRDKRRGRD